MRTWIISTLLAFSVTCAAQSHFRFVVTGDDRWNTSSPRPGDENGVNVVGMKRVAAAILREKPAILLFNGDDVGGAKTDEEEISQFQTFMSVMKPIYEAGIKVLSIRRTAFHIVSGAEDRARRVGPRALQGTM